QVATDIRLYLREAIDEIVAHIRRFRESLVDLAEQHVDTLMPGYTHLQVAQPVSFAHHLMAYYEMTGRDASWTAASGSTGCRSAQRRLPAPSIRSTANGWRANSVSRACARTRSTR